MPLMRCQKDKKRGWKWGSSGKCYTGPNARAQAAAQGRAIEASKHKPKKNTVLSCYKVKN